MDEQVVLGIDAGGSSTRVVLQDHDARVRAHVVTAGGNHHSSGADLTTRLAEAVGQALALAGHPPVVAAVAGLAGAGSAAGDLVVRRVRDALARHQVHCPTAVLTDLEIAFRAAAPGTDGALLLAGTGAVAASFHDGHLLRRCDGLGWRLGDEGSGWWIGSAGVRAAVAALEGRGPRTVLTVAVAEVLGVSPVTGEPSQDWVRAVAGTDPAALARAAPAVLDAAGAGDAVAADIVTDAATRLERTLSVAVGDDPVSDVVLAGGVLLADSPLRRQVTRAVERQGRDVHHAPHPVVGALRTARRGIAWPPGTISDVGEPVKI